MPSGTRAAPGPLTQEVAALIRGHAARRQIPAQALAEATGLSPSQVRKIMRGEKHVDIDVLDDLAIALEVDLVDLVRDADRSAEYRFSPPRDEG